MAPHVKPTDGILYAEPGAFIKNTGLNSVIVKRDLQRSSYKLTVNGKRVLLNGIQMLVSLSAAGFSAKEAAEILSFPYNSLIGKAAVLGYAFNSKRLRSAHSKQAVSGNGNTAPAPLAKPARKPGFRLGAKPGPKPVPLPAPNPTPSPVPNGTGGTPTVRPVSRPIGNYITLHELTQLPKACGEQTGATDNEPRYCGLPGRAMLVGGSIDVRCDGHAPKTGPR